MAGLYKGKGKEECMNKKEIFTAFAIKRLKKDLERLRDDGGNPHFLHERADEILIEFIVNLTQDDEIRQIWDGIPRWYS